MTSAADVHEPIDLSGEWSGHWESHTSGHQGPLHAIFCRIEEARYRVVYRGRFLKLLPFRYRSILEVAGYRDGKALIVGSKRLLVFGVFHFSAEATCEDFTATYESRKDCGVFIMHRK